MFVLFRFFFRIVFCSDFWSFFCPILGACWEALGGLLGVQNGHFWHRFLIDFGVSFQERPKSGQEPPKSAQERPKSGQKRPKSGPERPKSGQKRPKSSQERARSSQEPQKSVIFFGSDKFS